MLVSTGIAYRARHISPYSPKLETIEIPLGNRKVGAASVRIAFVADTHIGPVVRAVDVERALELLRQENPDILLLGGDYICESPRHAIEAAAVLGAFASSLRFGALAVLGNHDYANDAARLTTLFEKRGIRVLRNESAQVAADVGDFWVAGIDDAILGTPDLQKSFAQIPENAASLALWHEPDWAVETSRFGPILQLSGHSHGGQVRIPFLGVLAAPAGGRRYVAGLNYAGGMPVYTTRGVGVFRPPVRFRCPPEVTLISLRAMR